MSRLAKKPIPIPDGAEVRLESGRALCKGPKGELALSLLPGISAEIKGKEVWVMRSGDERKSRTNQGTTWSLIRNALEGVTRGYAKTLEIEGVGYRAAAEGRKLTLHLGYANPVSFPLPAGIEAKTDKSAIIVSGIDKELVGRVAAEIRSLKKPEPYKGKGIHYQGEVIRRKAGKKAGATTAAA